MTPDMIALAEQNAAKGDYPQVEFRHGFIEDLPVDDDSIDVVISNCVVNLSPDKRKVYQEAFRVLKAGGRISISDPERITDIPEAVKEREDAFCGCIAGAASREELLDYLTSAGFIEIKITPKGETQEVIDSWASGADTMAKPGSYVVSMMIEAIKPVIA